LKLSKDDKIEIFENSISWVLVLALFIYGFGKTIQFESSTEINKTVSQLSGQELMWAFYGYSKSYALLLGFIEIIGGVLILLKKTRLIGCILTSFIFVNVIIQDIVFSVVPGALRAAIFYQILVIIILSLNYKKVISSIKTLYIVKTNTENRKRTILKFLIAFIIFVILRIFEYFITLYL
jgi:hypothetical protein